MVAVAEAESDTHTHVQNRLNNYPQTQPAQVRVGKESAAHCVLAVQYAACSSVLARWWRPSLRGIVTNMFANKLRPPRCAADSLSHVTLCRHYTIIKYQTFEMEFVSNSRT